jgi:hypothetical protein
MSFTSPNLEVAPHAVYAPVSVKREWARERQTNYFFFITPQADLSNLTYTSSNRLPSINLSESS